MRERAVARVDAIAAGGAGVARVDGLAVFVPRTAPGDLADIEFVRRGRMGEGRLLQLHEPSPSRVDPSCRHYDGDRCGGCQLQHLAYDAQLSAKHRIVTDALQRIARRESAAPPVVPSADAWEYRNRLALAMRWRGGEWVVGLHRWDDVDSVFDLVECPITHSTVLAGWGEVRGAARLLPRAPELRGSVRLSGGALSFVLEGGSSWPTAQEFCDAAPSLAAVRWIDAAGQRRAIVDRAGASTAPASFEQVNAAVAVAMHTHVAERARTYRPSHVVDAYAGSGAIARRIASPDVRVTAIELDAEAARRAARDLAPPSEVRTGRVEALLPGALPADVVVLNPPRTGVDARVCELLSATRSAPQAIVYVSCDPATLARDLTRLPSWRVAHLQSFDMFPQTAHVETVCELVPEGA